MSTIYFQEDGATVHSSSCELHVLWAADFVFWLYTMAAKVITKCCFLMGIFERTCGCLQSPETNRLKGCKITKDEVHSIEQDILTQDTDDFLKRLETSI